MSRMKRKLTRVEDTIGTLSPTAHLSSYMGRPTHHKHTDVIVIPGERRVPHVSAHVASVRHGRSSR